MSSLLLAAAPRDSRGELSPKAPLEGTKLEIVRVEKRSTAKMVDYAGKIARPDESGPLLFLVEVPWRMGVGDGVAVIPGDSTAIIPGRVRSVAALQEPQKGFRATIVLPSAPGVGDGDTARLRLQVADRRVLAVPDQATRRAEGKTTVQQIYPDERIETVTIETGEPLPGGWIEVRSGLSLGDRVVSP